VVNLNQLMAGGPRNEDSIRISLMIGSGSIINRGLSILLYILPFILILESILFNDAKSIATEFANLSFVKVSFLAAGLLLAAGNMRIRKDKIKILVSPDVLIIITYLLFIIWVNHKAGSDLNVLFERRVIALFFYFFCLFIFSPNTDDRVVFFARALSLTVLVVLALTFYELPFAHINLIFRPNAIRGPFENSSHLSTFLVMCLPFVGYRVKGTLANGRIPFYLILAITMIFTIIICNQRSAWLALVFVLACFLVPAGKLRAIFRRPVYICSFVVFILSVLIAMYLYRPRSAQGRLLVAKIAVTELDVSPATGNGVGSLLRDYLNAQARYFSKPRTRSEKLAAGEIYTVYNEYLLAYFESGMIGCLLIFMYVFIKLLRVLHRRINSELAQASYCTLAHME
jgi:O-antigen polymerase